MKNDKEVSESITISIPSSIIKIVIVCGFGAWTVWILYQMVILSSQSHH